MEIWLSSCLISLKRSFFSPWIQIDSSSDEWESPLWVYFTPKVLSTHGR